MSDNGADRSFVSKIVFWVGVSIFLAVGARSCIESLPEISVAPTQTQTQRQNRPTPRPPEPHSFKLRPGEQYRVPNHGGIVTTADWNDVYTIILLDFGSATKQYQGWSKDIYVSLSEMRRAKYIVYIRPTEEEFEYLLRTGQFKGRGHKPHPQVAGYDITMGDFRL